MMNTICQCTIAAHLGVKDVGVYRLIVVVLVPIIEEAEKSIFEDLVDGGLASASGAHTHESMTHQLSLIQLNHVTNLTTHTVTVH